MALRSLLEEGPVRRFMKQLTHADRDRFEKQLEEVWKPELEKCKLVEDFDKRVACKSEILHGISVAQDLVNLGIRGDFYRNDPKASQDIRFRVANLLDNANAVFLGVSDARYDPEQFLEIGYVEPKADKFCSRWRRILFNSYEPEDLRVKKRTDEDRAKAVKEMDEKDPDWRKYI